MYCLALSLWTSHLGVDRVDVEVAGHAVHCAEAAAGWAAGVRSGFIARALEDGEELRCVVHRGEGSVQKCQE